MIDSPIFALLDAVPRYLQLRRSQYWDPGRLEAYRRDRLNQTFRAAMKIPFYASRFGATPSSGDLGVLPILKRPDIADLSRSVRSLYPPDAQFIHARSSGTIGHAVDVLFDRTHQSGRNAARARYLVENGWRPTCRTAWALGLVTEPRSPDGDLSRSRYLLRSQFLSHTEDFAVQIAWLRKMDPHFIYTLPSNLDALLMFLDGADPKLPSLRKVFTGGEVLEDSLRNRTRKALGVGIVDSYGMTELFPAWQCPAGSYHVNAEHLMIELLDDDGHPVKAGELGRVVATTLENHLAPLIRYDLNDYALAVEGACSCGRTLPTIGRVVGRSINLFRLKTGELFLPWRLYDHLHGLDKVRQLQLVQRALDHFIVRFVRDEPLAPDVEASIRQKIAESLGGGVTVSLERVDEIARTRRGKFMAALCEIAPPETSNEGGQAV
jgi:phenylacetate-coenzyme A ligase PaaK-like adenylate-forming protein